MHLCISPSTGPLLSKK
ncbi:hypothetical protein F383_36415 [Gossypium arboreum]|uniref:Uncharacterized protein n=1 Tax=Gossypium arboreum TaxID=29729 RepID=A0A0B0NNC7_GOSAR|nr:hypothetical protein F383_20147 [Gossypium arboreum]KHG30753.1 hypothetical protein F383_36415 [Gossypium arboreum]